MNERHSMRYDSEFLPEGLKKVAVSWDEDTSIETAVINCCAPGIRVIIPPLLLPASIPRKNDIIKVLIPLGPTWLSGMCVYVTNEHDGSVSMGIYFYNPSEQNHLNEILFKSVGISPQTHTFICYEWEELVARLCNSEDPKLKEIGCQEMKCIKEQQEKNGAFR